MSRLLDLARAASAEPLADLPPLGYTQADLIELDRLIARWHELARAPGAAKTLAIRRRMAPVDVAGELRAFRKLVEEAGAREGGLRASARDEGLA